MTKPVTTTGAPIRDGHGRPGVRVTLEFDASSGMAGIYHFATHGMTPSEVAAKHDEIAEYHSRSTAAISDWQAAKRRHVFGDTAFTITDCTVELRGDTPRVLCVARLEDATRVEVHHWCRNATELPSGAEIVQLMRARAAEMVHNSAVADEHAQAVRSALKLG